MGIVRVSDIMKIKKEKEKFMGKVDETWVKAQIMGRLDGKETLLGPYENIMNYWKDEPCFVVGSSPGLENCIKEGFKWKMLNGFHSIGISDFSSDASRR